MDEEKKKFVFVCVGLVPLIMLLNKNRFHKAGEAGTLIIREQPRMRRRGGSARTALLSNNLPTYNLQLDILITNFSPNCM